MTGEAAIEFLTVPDVEAIQELQLASFGGLAGIRDPGLLEAAVAQPQMTFGGEFLHEDLFAMAAAYLFHLVRNHPFVDGNKRAGLAAALTFLDLNGVSIDDPEGRLYELTMAAAEGRIEKPAIAGALRALAGR